MSSLLLAVDPVPWARAQMAFTLATHIILVAAIVIHPSLGLLSMLDQKSLLERES